MAEITFDPEEYCNTTSACKHGNRIEDLGYSTAPWIPFTTDNSFVWVADACLGYFMTRSEIALNVDAVTSGVGGDGIFRIYAELGDYRTNLADSGRLQIFNYPFSQYGVFRCENMRWPPLQFDPAEFERWVDTRMTAENGWTPSNRFGGAAAFRNEEFGALVRVYEIGGDYTFSIEADYFGPPIVIIE